MKPFIYPALIVCFCLGVAGASFHVSCVLGLLVGIASWLSWHLTD